MSDRPERERIRVGPAGWSYSDWKGIVYPAGAGFKFDPLRYIASFFDTIEINSTFYRPPSSSTSASWARRVAHNPQFKFSAKLNRGFTHEHNQTEGAESEFRAGMDPLVEAGVLGALLVQFPWSFKNTTDERKVLMTLLKRFNEYPLVVELRHASWNRPEIYQSLSELGVGFCNIDQPLFANSIKPSALTTSVNGYIRLHGRNYQNWFRENSRPSDRYDYLYSLDELEPWVDNIKAVSEHAEETYVITNNHFRGQAVVNALEIKAQISGKHVPAPETLLEAYPRLRDMATPEYSGS